MHTFYLFFTCFIYVMKFIYRICCHAFTTVCFSVKTFYKPNFITERYLRFNLNDGSFHDGVILNQLRVLWENCVKLNLNDDTCESQPSGTPLNIPSTHSHTEKEKTGRICTKHEGEQLRWSPLPT